MEDSMKKLNWKPLKNLDNLIGEMMEVDLLKAREELSLLKVRKP